MCLFTPPPSFDTLPQTDQDPLRGAGFPTTGDNQAEAEETDVNSIIQEHGL